MRLFAIASVAAIGLALYTPGAGAGTPDEDYILRLINQERNSRTTTKSNDEGTEQRRRRRRRARRPKPPGGATTLVEHAIVLGEVRAHSQDMSARGSLDHNGFESRVSRIRAADSGINGHICENVATLTGQSGQAALDTIFRLWMESPPHRACMLDLESRSHSAAVGLFVSGDQLWATFITAADQTP